MLKVEEDIYKWAFNWAEMCDCQIVPVLTDSQARSIIKNKFDGFQDKLEAVKEAMNAVQV